MENEELPKTFEEKRHEIFNKELLQEYYNTNICFNCEGHYNSRAEHILGICSNCEQDSEIYDWAYSLKINGYLD